MSIISTLGGVIIDTINAERMKINSTDIAFQERFAKASACFAELQAINNPESKEEILESNRDGKNEIVVRNLFDLLDDLNAKIQK